MIRTAIIACVLIGKLAFAEPDPSATTTPAYILILPETVTTVLVAETDTSTLHRFEHVAGKIERRDTAYMSVGQNGVGKQRAWDRRTPLGIYFANDQLDTSRMHEKYGATAFPLDYPNAWDRYRDRTGDGIWIHGMLAGKPRPALDTDGCIALPNEDVTELEHYLELLITPVIITRTMRSESPQQVAADREQLMSVLATWARSFRDGDWHAYLSLYAADFTYRGLNRDEWSAYRVRSATTRPLRDFSIDDIMLLADPEQDGLFLSRFRQTISDDAGQIVTTKRLYWLRDASGEFSIVTEDNG